MRRLLLIAGLVLALWAGGFAAFVLTLPRGVPATPAKADAVVVYTGEGMRIAPALALLEQGVAPSLLISGVNPQTTRPELAAMWDGDPALFECCVELGHEARSTIGNADEARGWVLKRGYRSLVLVTSDYHMPRALAETRKRLPEVAVAPFPVESGLIRSNGLPKDLGAARKLATEYTKFLAAFVWRIVDGGR